MSETHKRRFSLEADFMNYSTDDLLFGAMYHLSTYHPNYQKLYLSKKNFQKNKKIIYELCDLNAQNLKRHLDKLLASKLIAEGEIVSNDEKIPVYFFPFDYNGNYQLIDNEMLWYIASTRNHQAIRLYVYLLNCFLWKQKEQEAYIFTNIDLMKSIGYSQNNKLASSMVSNILESFAREGIIEYVEFYEEIITNKGKSVPTPKKKLMFVASTKDQLLPIN